jgi:hypothetical protein
MRENKFRAWDAEQNKMLYDNDLWLPSSILISHAIIANAKTCYPIKITNHGIVSGRQLGNSFIWVEIHDDRDKPKSRAYYDEWEGDIWTSGFPIMQYTGLFDKIGKKIYECDIVRQGDNHPSVIEWNQLDEMIEGTGYCLHEYYPKTTKKDDRYHTTSAYTNGLEVIGNIYENPELLKGANNHAV